MNDIRSVRAAAPRLELLEEYNRRKTEGDPDMPCISHDDSADSADDGRTRKGDPGDKRKRRDRDGKRHSDDFDSDDDSYSDDDSDSDDSSGSDDSSDDDRNGGGSNEPPPADVPPPADEPPPVVQSCGCWSADELVVIDGVLDPVRNLVPGVRCTVNNNATGVYEAQVFEGYNLDTASPVVVNSAFAYVDPNGGVTTQGCMFESPTAGIRNFPLAERAEAEHCIQMIVEQCSALGL